MRRKNFGSNEPHLFLQVPMPRLLVQVNCLLQLVVTHLTMQVRLNCLMNCLRIGKFVAGMICLNFFL